MERADQHNAEARGARAAQQDRFVWPPRPPQPEHAERSDIESRSAEPQSQRSKPQSIPKVTSGEAPVRSPEHVANDTIRSGQTHSDRTAQAASDPTGPPARESRTTPKHTNLRPTRDWPELRPSPERLLGIERYWLGLTKPRFADLASDEDWSPEASDEFCTTCGRGRGPHEALSSARIEDSRPGIGRAATAQPRCVACRHARFQWDRVIRLGPYEGALRDAVHAIKFEASRRTARDLGRVLGRQVMEVLRESGADEPRSGTSSASRIVVVPMSTTFRRRVSRGIDHAGCLARALASIVGGRVVPAVRRRHRPSQVLVPHSERRANVAGTMTVRRRAARGLLGATLVIVVDDVTTTGATASECCRALRAAMRQCARAESDGRAKSRIPPIWLAVLAGPRPDGRDDEDRAS